MRELSGESPKGRDLTGDRLKSFFIEKVKDPLAKLEPFGGASGGESFRAQGLSGREYFVKQGSRPFLHAEAEGLRELARPGVIGVPRVFAQEGEYLVTELIRTKTPTQVFWETFGRQLALLHQNQSEHFGWHKDGFIGLAPQRNLPSTPRAAKHWAEFFWRDRLCFQLDLLRQSARLTPEFEITFQKAEPNIRDILSAVQEPPSLLHGDLWNGNFICGADGLAYLIDPAVYYGHRESDLAMAQLFGGFPDEFYQAYRVAWPLQEDWLERLGIYKLYHLMNHWNLFGVSYYDQAYQTLRTYI